MLQADSTGWRPLVEAGQLRLLMIWTKERSKNWPEAPTLGELGYPFDLASPFGIAGPKGMDPAIVRKLHDAFKAAIEDPGVIETLRKYDMAPAYQDTATYVQTVERFVKEETEALRAMGLARKD